MLSALTATPGLIPMFAAGCGSDPDRLGPGAHAAIDADDARLLLSDASVWEVCLKWSAAKIHLPAPPRRWIADQMATWRVERCPLELDHYFRTTELPSLHRDPFDRLLVAQAIAVGASIVTPDAAIRAYPVAVLWD